MGLPRVEITKPGENVPAMYNTTSTLGPEFAHDTRSRDGIQFRLQY
jgi:hypothetical protein